MVEANGSIGHTSSCSTRKRATTAVASLLLAAGLLGAPAIAPANAADAVCAQQESRSTSTRPQTQRLSDLARLEDESLAKHTAGEWSDAEVILTLLLLIFLFPIGLIVLIVLLI